MRTLFQVRNPQPTTCVYDMYVQPSIYMYIHLSLIHVNTKLYIRLRIYTCPHNVYIHITPHVYIQRCTYVHVYTLSTQRVYTPPTYTVYTTLYIRACIYSTIHTLVYIQHCIYRRMWGVYIQCIWCIVYTAPYIRHLAYIRCRIYANIFHQM